MLSVLFLCTGNSCRSQMAEGWARHLKLPGIQAHSAGIIAKGVDPRAARAMAEVGVDISGQRSKTLDDVLSETSFDFVITLCGHAHETCPVFPDSTRVIHQGFDDPPTLADCAATEEEAMQHYRRVRDEIRQYVVSLPDVLRRSNHPTTSETDR